MSGGVSRWTSYCTTNYYLNKEITERVTSHLSYNGSIDAEFAEGDGSVAGTTAVVERNMVNKYCFSFFWHGYDGCDHDIRRELAKTNNIGHILQAPQFKRPVLSILQLLESKKFGCPVCLRPSSGS